MESCKGTWGCSHSSLRQVDSYNTSHESDLPLRLDKFKKILLFRIVRRVVFSSTILSIYGIRVGVTCIVTQLVTDADYMLLSIGVQG